jgi:probable HAF family extracellular repeat protein
MSARIIASVLVLAISGSPAAWSAPTVNSGPCPEDPDSTCYTSIQGLEVGSHTYNVSWVVDTWENVSVSSPGASEFIGNSRGASLAAEAINRAFDDDGNQYYSSLSPDGTLSFGVVDIASAQSDELISSYLAFSIVSEVVGPLSIPADEVRPYAVFELVAAPQTMYRITDLGALGGVYTYGYRINDVGQVVGQSDDASGAYRPFLWEAGSMTDLGSLGGAYGSANGINESGQVVGGSQLATGAFRAFLWDNGTMTDLGVLEDNVTSMAYGMNDVGQVVGNSSRRAFLWENGAITDIGDLGADGAAASDVNSSGQVIGWSFQSGRFPHAFLWENGQMADLGTLGGASSYAYGISDSGQVVGEAQASAESNRYWAFLWDAGTMHALGVVDGSAYSYAGDINSVGQVVGAAGNTNFQEVAVIWNDGFATDLNTRIDPTDPLLPYVHLSWAWGINATGQIVVNGKDSRISEEHSRAYLLTPLSDDSTPPIVNAVISGTLGNNDWYVSDVEISWNISDPESTISSTSGCESVILSIDNAGTTYTCSATSAGGTTTSSVTVKRDATPPTATASVSGAQSANGWFNKDVTVSFSGSDAMSGGVSCDASVRLSTEGADQSITGYCYDAAGNQSESATAEGINIDKSPPQVVVTSPANGATYARNQVVVADYSCSDLLSGVASCVGSVNPGSLIDTSKKAKNRRFTVDAADLAGNKIRHTVTYSVN